MDENNKVDIIEDELESATPDNASLTEEDLSDNSTVEDSTDNNTADEVSENSELPQKKKGFFQTPVIIALCLVVAAILGYFTYTAFFLKEPEGVTWSAELEGITYYIDFNNDNTFKAYIGSVELEGTYIKEKNQPKQDLTGATFDESETVNTLTVNYQIANFFAGAPAEYWITGSRILGNQVLHCSYGENYEFTLQQAKRQKPVLEVSKDFEPDKELIGTWVFSYQGQDIYKLTINEDGTMSFKRIQEGFTYNGTYTISDGNINFTYFVNESDVVPIEYSVNGDILTCMGVNFVREGSGATPDQPIAEITDPEGGQEAQADAATEAAK